jgi:UDP-N-acetylglucosamine 2-epimerase (non-hydrolysing)
MKIAPIMHELGRADGVRARLVHTGQHYDEKMSRLFFTDLGIPTPDVNLEVGSGSHAVQTAEIMKRIEPVYADFQPDWVVVVGDVNGTMAAALTAVKLGIPVAHVEAGLRSFDRAMPEEINRLVTDAISDALFVTEPSAVENLRREGVAEEKIHLVGNVMVDTLLRHRATAAESKIVATLGLDSRGYALVTLHRPSNVDDPGVLGEIFDALEVISADMPIVFPVHPRSRSRIQSFGLGERVEAIPGLRLLEPLGYLDFVRLMDESAVVLTDSGGIQEETTVLGVPCLTLRENTERPITLTEGTNQLTGTSKDRILSAYARTRGGSLRAATVPYLWDGRAAERIVQNLLDRK